MVSQRTVLIVSAISAAFLIVVLGLLTMWPNSNAIWMYDCNKAATQAAFDYTRNVGNYEAQLLWWRVAQLDCVSH